MHQQEYFKYSAIKGILSPYITKVILRFCISKNKFVTIGKLSISQKRHFCLGLKRSVLHKI